MTTLPVDPADLFTALYDALPEAAFGNGSVERWYQDPAVQDEASRVRDRVWAGGLDEVFVSDVAHADDERRFTVLVALDVALDAINPFSGAPLATALNRIASRYASTGRLDTGIAGGALLFGSAFPGRPLGLPLKDQFFGLVRVPEYIWNQIDFHLVPNAFDLNIEPIQRRRRGVCVGCAPLVDSYDEMLIEKSARGRFSRAGYRLAPRDDAVIPRIATVLDRLDAAGAVIGVMPEATLSAAVREHWVEALRLQSAASGSLEWVLVGTGPDGLSDPPPNRAYLLHRTGAVILRQDKMRDFTLTADQIERWRLTDALGKRRKRVEDITPGTRLQLAESNLGRVAIAICEDLARPEIGELIRRSGVSLVLVPIFSGEVNASWAFYASERVMQDTGASLVIATSLAVPKAMSPTASTWSTCGAGGPREDRDEWDYVFEDGSTTDPDEVTTLTIAGALVRRYFDFS